MKKLLFLSIFTALINSAELQFKVKDLTLPAEFPKLTDLAIKKIVEQYDFKSVLKFIDEQCAGDENLKLAASRYWFKLNKNKLFKIASQKYGITPEHTLNGHANWINSVVISRDKVVTKSSINSVIVWDLNSGAKLHTLNGTDNWISSIAVSDDKVVIASYDKTAIIWDLNTGAKLHTLNCNDNWISSIAISGDKVVTGSYDKTAIIWDLNTGIKLNTLNGHDRVNSVAISGDKVVTVSYDKTAIIWDLNTGAKLHTLNCNDNWISSIAISGDKVVTGSYDKTIIWDLNQPITQLLPEITFDSLIKVDKITNSPAEDITMLLEEHQMILDDLNTAGPAPEQHRNLKHDRDENEDERINKRQAN